MKSKAEDLILWYNFLKKLQTISETLFSLFEKEKPFTLAWSHYLQLMLIDDANERLLYEIEAKQGAWQG